MKKIFTLFPNPGTETSFRVQVIDVHKEFTKTGHTLLVIRLFVDFLGALRTCALILFSISGFGILIITNIALASDVKNIETDARLNESLALSQHFKEFSNHQMGTNWRSVGAGGCQHSSIQAAIDDYTQSALGMIGIPIEFRIATNKTYFENLVIGGNYDISLKGGYSDCSNMAGIPGNNQVLINAANNGVAITIQGVITRRSMAFTNLRLINGNNATGAGGGLLSDNSNVALLLDNVDIRNNNAQFGAGLAIVNGDTDLIMNDSLIFGNVADYGGGIYCSGGSSSVNVALGSGIISNFANNPSVVAPNGRGGGVYTNGCYFAIFSGSHINATLTGMDLNSSMNRGGAIYAQNATIRIHGHQFCGSQGCLGDNINPISLISNQSNSLDGAVLYAKNSDIRINAAWIEGNIGASILYVEDSILTIQRFLQECWSNEDCNLIENNNGTILKAINNDDIDISSVNIDGNVGTVFDVSYPALTTPVPLPSFRVESCMINNNETTNPYLFDFFGSLDVAFVHNTIADNQVTQSIFRTDYNSNLPADPTTLEIHSNIISNSGHDVYSYDLVDFDNGLGDSMHIIVGSSFLNETNSLTVPSTLINDAIDYPDGDLNSTLDPQFIDRANGNYHLSVNSPAIDYFHTPFRIALYQADIDYESRGIDDPNTAGLLNHYHDIGADEITDTDLIFANDFE